MAKKQAKQLRLCRSGRGHYWDKRTGERAKDPAGLCFTTEETCPKHSR